MRTEAVAESAHEYLVVGVANRGGWLHGRDHLSLDNGDSTLCGLINKSAGGRSDILPLPFIDKAHRSPYLWDSAAQCERCARSAPDGMVSTVARWMREQDW